MPKFDPDKYLKSDVKPSGFDPDKYLGIESVEKKNPIQNGQKTGSQPLKLGLERFQAQAPTEAPSVLTPEYRDEYKAQVDIDTQKKKDLSKQLQSAKDVYYQAQGDASSFSSYNGLQSDLKKIDDEISKNYSEDATVSRTVSGQEDFQKYKAKRDQLVSDREKLNQLSNEVLLRIDPTIQSKIESDLKKNGLEAYTRKVYSGTQGFNVADEFKIDDYAKQVAEDSGLSDDGPFKKLVYNKVKSTVSREIIAPEIQKRFVQEFKKKTGMTPDQAIEKDQISNFFEGKKIQLELSTSVDSLNKEIKEKVDSEVNTITQQYKPVFESLNVDYKNKISEAESSINQLNESYKAGGISRPQYELAFNNIKSQLDLVNQQYKQQSDNLSKEYLNGQNELFSKYNKRFNRQVYELQSMADQKLSAAAAKFGKEYKPSAELKNQFESIYNKAAKNYFEEDESIKYQLDKSSLLNLVGGQTAKNLFIGFGGSLKSLSAISDFDLGYVLGDYLENSFVSSSSEIKSAWDLLDFTKLQSSVGRMVGGMAPILGASALTASVTKSAPTALRLLTTGLSNYLIETAQIGGGVKDDVFKKTGNIADANKAARKVMDANLYLLPLYALDGLPFLGNITLGIKNTFARAGAKAGIEVLTETPQEYFQGIFEELAVADKPISDTFKNMTLERLEDTALNVIPTSVLLGGGGTAIQGVRESISKMQGRSLAAKVDLADLTETTKKQFIYDTVLRRGDVFSKAYVSSLFNSGNINEQEMESFSKMIDDSSNIMAESKKIGLNKAQSKVYAALRFDYLQSKNEFDSEQDEVSKKVYKAKMDSAEKSLNTYLSGGKPDAVLLTLANNEQYIYSFETLNSIINEGGEILNQIVSGEVSIGLLSDKTNPKAKELSDKLTKLKQDFAQGQAVGDEIGVTITPENSSNYANMTEDDKGNFVFFHVGNKGYETIKPGTGASTVTSREEAAALSKVGGLGMYYTNADQVERQSAEGAKYAVKIPKEKVYDFNTDKLNLIEEAEARHEAENPGKAFDINSQLAYVTKIAGEKGFDMVVAQWNNMTRAQTTKELTPTDVQESEGNVVKKDFNEKYESNRQKGFEPVVPVAKSKKFQNVYDKIEKVRDKEQKYDNLYRLYYESNKYNQDEITELINNSDLPQEIKDEYKEILESKEETRRSQQTKPKEAVSEDVEAKKADIEKRRQEELDTVIQTTPIEVLDEEGNVISTSDKKVKINAKYDAELAALEQTKPKEDAIQEQAAGQVPVQPKATVGEKVEQGKPEAKPKVVTEEGVKAEEVVGEKIKVENAPKGNHLNIGLNEGRTKKKMSSKGVLSKLPKDVKVISSVEIDVAKGEPTLVIETSRPLTDLEMAKLLGDTKQQAIPQLSNGEGVLYDVKRGTKDGWGEFDPDLFLLQDGKSLGEYSKTEGSKQKEVESNIETAIDLLDGINENKRKAERASSKRKAELESKIAEDTKELDNIPDATALVRSINDNFDAIKKELKEKGLLKIKC
jgi:AraC-like DNA-binding protein